MTSRFDFLDKYNNKTVSYFDSELEQVIQWNAIARNGKHDKSSETLNLQYSLVLEEFEEFKTAVAEQDIVETVDALCDLFVVAGYYLFLTDNKTKAQGQIYEFSEACEHVYYPPQVYDSRVKALFQYVCDALASLKGGHDYLQDVLDSNMSKFATKGFFEDKGILPEVVATNIEMTSNRRYKNVVPIYSKVVDKETKKEVEYVLFRCDGGEGKILKPHYFHEPDIEEVMKNYL